MMKKYFVPCLLVILTACCPTRNLEHFKEKYVQSFVYTVPTNSGEYSMIRILAYQIDEETKDLLPVALYKEPLKKELIEKRVLVRLYKQNNILYAKDLLEILRINSNSFEVRSDDRGEFSIPSADVIRMNSTSRNILKKEGTINLHNTYIGKFHDNDNAHRFNHVWGFFNDSSPDVLRIVECSNELPINRNIEAINSLNQIDCPSKKVVYIDKVNCPYNTVEKINIRKDSLDEGYIYIGEIVDIIVDGETKRVKLVTDIVPHYHDSEESKIKPNGNN